MYRGSNSQSSQASEVFVLFMVQWVIEYKLIIQHVLIRYLDTGFDRKIGCFWRGRFFRIAKNCCKIKK